MKNTLDLVDNMVVNDNFLNNVGEDGVKRWKRDLETKLKVPVVDLIFAFVLNLIMPVVHHLLIWLILGYVYFY